MTVVTKITRIATMLQLSSGIEGLGAGLELERVDVGVNFGEVAGEPADVTVGVGVGDRAITVDEGAGVAVGCGGCSRVSVFTKKMSW